MSGVLDLAIHDALVIDGSGAPGAVMDVGVRDGRIVRLVPAGELREAPTRERVAAEGLCLAPGFIDGHTHSDISLLASPDALPKISQGVTTEVIGNCGWSTVPGRHQHSEAFRRVGRPIFGYPETRWTWSDQEGYFSALRRQGTTVNVAALVGHGALRASVMGFTDRAPTAAELQEMKVRLDRALRQGALGLSTGLAYAPGCYASTAEISEISRVVAKHGGLYATHLRDQGDGLVESIEEALEIGRSAGVRVLISHHKTVGKENFGLVQRTLARLDEQHDQGHETYSDIYPYLAGSSTMLPLLPPWVLGEGDESLPQRLRNPACRQRIRRDLRDGLSGWENRARTVGWENIFVARVASEGNRRLVGQDLAAIARERGVDEVDAMLDLLAEEDGEVSSLIVNSCEDDLVTVMNHPRTMVGSDGIDFGERPHPRLYGTFPRVLGRYVRDLGALTLESAIHKMTGLNAGVFGFKERGLIALGYLADLVLFDPGTVADLADYEQPRRYASGILDVWVNGRRVFRDGRSTGERPGCILRNNQLSRRSNHVHDPSA
ncbi:MAG: D-aminoacylase [Trueperaceae bacterium]